MPIIGGSSLLSTGGMNVAGSKQQKAAGINDTPEMFTQDTLKVGKGTNDKVLVNVLTEQSNSALEWFESLGGKLDLDPGVSAAAKLRACTTPSRAASVAT